MIRQTLFNSYMNQLDSKKKNKYYYSDEKLMLLFQGGDEDAYIELVNRCRDKLINFIYGCFW